MTDKEMIILKSCLRYIHQEALNSSFYPNNLTKEELSQIQNSSFEGGGIQSEELPYHILGDIRAVIYNYHAGIFDNKVREVEIPFLQFKNLLEKKINNKHNNDDGDELIYLQQPLYAGIGENITKDFSSMNWAWVNAMRIQLDFGPLTTNTLLLF